MNSPILQTASKYILPLMIVFSLFLLLRGHNLPGGGFTGGLTAAAAYTLFAIAHGVEEAKRLLRVEPLYLIASGLSVAILSGLVAWAMGDTFMTGQWSKASYPIIGKLGTPLIFDFGVYFVVIGIVLKIIFTLGEEELTEG